MSQLKLWRVIIYGKNTHTMNDIARVEVIMLDVSATVVAERAKSEMGYGGAAKTEVEELTGPYDAGYLISYRELTAEPLPDLPRSTRPTKGATARPKTVNATEDVLAEFDALFND